ncbi:hypothetical protein BGP75_15250 [Motiliproteus sp. MSK22-1]|nr:hypothetical protein BGP75_15250 [Motiliproteus sp. MSK22-1]
MDRYVPLQLKPWDFAVLSTKEQHEKIPQHNDKKELLIVGITFAVTPGSPTQDSMDSESSPVHGRPKQ